MDEGDTYHEEIPVDQTPQDTQVDQGHDLPDQTLLDGGNTWDAPGVDPDQQPLEGDQISHQGLADPDAQAPESPHPADSIWGDVAPPADQSSLGPEHTMVGASHGIAGSGNASGEHHEGPDSVKSVEDFIHDHPVVAKTAVRAAVVATDVLKHLRP